MPQGSITPVSEMTGNMSKLEREIRAQIEAEIANKEPRKPKPDIILSKEERKIFNRLVKLNDNFTEDDSKSLTILTRSLHRYSLLNDVLNDLDPLDEQSASLERRIHAFDKSITTHMTLLNIPLTQRLRMANDMAKRMIEEKKLEQMTNNAQPKEINPLVAILEARKK
ncbi:hypothetical protein [Peribacillus sp. NPDC060253]|uniref:hypothetical protein n=1 Tax=Peribacillus sp. NPDC060253 TaxID=3347084 RepID=UPI0036601F29